MHAITGAGYVTFGSQRRSMRGAFATANSADKDIIPKLEALRASSRDMFMNSPIATGALRRSRTNIVGYGLAPQARIDNTLLNISDDDARAWEDKVESEFYLWANSKDCDLTRTQNFWDLQGLVLLSTLLSGDCFVALPRKPRPGCPYDIRVKVIEADIVTNPHMSMDTEKIAGGVEVDGDGAPVKYYLQKQHPGGFDYSNDWIPVEAFSSVTGRRQIYHLYDRERPGQRRGIPLLAPVIESLKQLTRLAESELAAAVVSSFFTAFIKSNAASANPLADGFADAEKITAPETRTDDVNTYEMGPASIIGLNDGEDVVIADPKRPNAAFEPFFGAIVRQIGSSIEIPSELLMLHFTASYSASRAALLEAWKFFNMRRTWLEREFCRPVYEEWLSEAVSKGRVSAPGFFLDPAIRAAWSDSKWAGPGQGQLDPVRETEAMLMKIGGNISTHTKETAAIDGDDWQTMVRARAREKTMLEEHGLITAPQPAGNQGTGAAAKTEDDKTRDQEDKLEQGD